MLQRTPADLPAAAPIVLPVAALPEPDDDDPLLTALLAPVAAAGFPQIVIAEAGARLAARGVDRAVAAAAATAIGRAVRFDRRRGSDRPACQIVDMLPATAPLLCLPLPHRGRLTVLGCLAPRGAAPWGDAEAAALHRLEAWLAPALATWRGLHEERARRRSAERALDTLAVGVLLLDAEGRLLGANRCGRALLDEGDALRIAAGTVSAALLDDAVRLQLAIRHVAEDRLAPAPVLHVRRRRGRPLIAAALPLGGGDGEAAVALLALDSDRSLDGAVDPACRLHGLTATEARLTRHLVAGLSLADAAAAMRIQTETARAYLKTVFAKTGTHRQADLVRTVLASLLPTHPDERLTVL